MPGWTNLDADPRIPAQIHALVPPIPLEDGSLDEVYLGHCLEHLLPEDGLELLRECRRCLIPGGKIAVLVPDTHEIMRRYLAGDETCVEYPRGVFHPVADLDAVCRLFLYSTVQPSHHLWSYDRETLARAMTAAGFRELQEIDRFLDPRIACGAWYQIGLEGVRP